MNSIEDSAHTGELVETKKGQEPFGATPRTTAEPQQMLTHPSEQHLYKFSLARAAIIIEELEDFMIFLKMETMRDKRNGIAAEICRRFEESCIKFSKDLLLANGYMPEIARRLNVKRE